MSGAAVETAAGHAVGGNVSGTSAGPSRLRRRFRAWRLWIILALVLAGGVVLSLLTSTSADRTPLSAGNPSPNGAQALVRVLGERGVDVVQAPDFNSALRALDAQDATLLFFDPNEYLGAGQLAELRAAAGKAVLVEPTFAQLRGLAPGISQAGLVPEETVKTGEVTGPRCADPAAEAAGTVSAGGLAYRGPVTCFPVTGGAGEPAGLFAAEEDGSAAVLGYSGLLANGTITENGNAALALRSLGSAGTLVWYLPVPSDIPAGDAPANPFSLLPDWVDPLLAWVVVVAAIAAFWRGRRLGPLAMEPMPVVVRASETADGRARLYQDSRALDRAAANLRAGTMVRLAARLRLGPGSTSAAVVEAAARSTGRPVSEIDALLNRHAPANDSDLVTWSQELLYLEEEITES
ncbi:DUF4350 domain-containing protein [Arthrobacter sp. BL-252-APC-1A]|uniref:DUF4350 domain-containing protein n=1 Tax=Arthrobacter sp. BL-252-APC-1A TaxID=2606622 RepID=UPI0012B24505|nr:DUF4350 domain-containing protein [Arthrobacter sp. BL-252-APC-1A]MSR98199.1 DUF4350 domain-containing protein [Arthrobacter sp. BL-252-APC-1A]